MMKLMGVPESKIFFCQRQQALICEAWSECVPLELGVSGGSTLRLYYRASPVAHYCLKYHHSQMLWDQQTDHDQTVAAVEREMRQAFAPRQMPVWVSRDRNKCEHWYKLHDHTNQNQVHISGSYPDLKPILGHTHTQDVVTKAN